MFRITPAGVVAATCGAADRFTDTRICAGEWFAGLPGQWAGWIVEITFVHAAPRVARGNAEQSLGTVRGRPAEVTFSFVTAWEARTRDHVTTVVDELFAALPAWTVGRRAGLAALIAYVTNVASPLDTEVTVDTGVIRVDATLPRLSCLNTVAIVVFVRNAETIAAT